MKERYLINIGSLGKSTNLLPTVIAVLKMHGIDNTTAILLQIEKTGRAVIWLAGKICLSIIDLHFSQK